MHAVRDGITDNHGIAPPVGEILDVDGWSGHHVAAGHVAAWYARLGLGRFGRQVLTVASGAAAGQIALLLASPVLTRLYDPDHFGALAAWVSIIAVLGGASTLRYHLAVVLPDANEDAHRVLAVCFAVVFLVAGALAAALPWIGAPILDLVQAPTLRPLLWLLPLTIAAIGLSVSLTTLASRVAAFGRLGVARASEGAGKAVAQIALGVAGLGGAGLVIGDTIARALGTAVLGVTMWRNGVRAALRSRRADMRDMARRYVDFARFGTASQLLNSAGLQAPALLFAGTYGLEVAGILALGQRVVVTPMVFVGQAASQVYLGTGARLAREDPWGLRRMFVKTSLRLLVLGLLPTLVLVAFGPFLFGVVFGPQWPEAGHYARILAPAFLIQFVVSPLSQTLNIVERQRWQLAWDAMRLAIIAGAIVGSATLQWEPREAVAAYSGAAAFAYLVHHVMGWLAIRSLCQAAPESDGD